MSVLDLVQQHLGQGQLQQLSQQIGADPAQTETAIEAALPMLLGGMAQTARQPDGAGQIAGAMQEQSGLLGGLGDLGNLGNLGGLGGILASAAGGGLLGKVLGGRESAVEGGVQQASGLDSNQTKKLLMLLAPIVLAMLARKRQQSAQANTANAGAMLDSDGDGIPDALEREAQDAREQTERRSPQIGGIIGKILDAATRH